MVQKSGQNDHFIWSAQVPQKSKNDQNGQVPTSSEKKGSRKWHSLKRKKACFVKNRSKMGSAGHTPILRASLNYVRRKWYKTISKSTKKSWKKWKKHEKTRFFSKIYKSGQKVVQKMTTQCSNGKGKTMKIGVQNDLLGNTPFLTPFFHPFSKGEKTSPGEPSN